MLEFRKYAPAPAGEEDPPTCAVGYPGPCGRPAVGEVWSLPFCGPHGEEAAAAASLEVREDAEREIEALMANEGGLVVRNPLLRRAMGGIDFLSGAPERDHDRALGAAYAPDEALTDPETLAFDYERDFACDGPHDWWSETRELVVRSMREASEAGLPQLLGGLESLRERATVQQELARLDYERRWVAPRRAEREERRRGEAGRDPSAEALRQVNGDLGTAMDRLDDVTPKAFADEEDYWRAKTLIARAGRIVAAPDRPTVRPADEPVQRPGEERR